MELSSQHYKKCNECGGEFVDTYLISFPSYAEEKHWSNRRMWEYGDHNSIFNQILAKGYLIYDEDNPDEDSDYYEIPQKSIHFIKGDT